MKPRPVSQAMQDVVGVPEIPRTQALKRIWAYIKEHDLQDPQNKRDILCDEKLKKIFEGKERVGFLEIAKLIGPHFLWMNFGWEKTIIGLCFAELLKAMKDQITY